MSDLPEMLCGTIAEEYDGMMRVAESEKPGPKSTEDPRTCTQAPDCKPKTPGPTCPPPKCKDTKAAFQPALAGWSTPPALDIR
jgi:hypothetical protein